MLNDRSMRKSVPEIELEKKIKEKDEQILKYKLEIERQNNIGKEFQEEIKKRVKEALNKQNESHETTIVLLKKEREDTINLLNQQIEAKNNEIKTLKEEFQSKVQDFQMNIENSKKSTHENPEMTRVVKLMDEYRLKLEKEEKLHVETKKLYDELCLKQVQFSIQLDSLKSELEKEKNEKENKQSQYDFAIKMNLNLKKENDELKSSFKKLEEENKQFKQKLESLSSLGTMLEEESYNPFEEDIIEGIEKMKKNDKNYQDALFVSKNLTDKDVSDICKAMSNNSNVLKLDFSDNRNITGECMKDVFDLVVKTKTLNELLFTGCPVSSKAVQKLKEGLKKNQSIVQCVAGLNETKEDIDEIEEIMNRNFEILNV